jgi:hypothetical protein
VLAMFVYASCAQVMASLLPLYLQNGRGSAPLEAGLAMLPFALAMLALPQVGRLLGRYLTSSRILVLGLGTVGIGNAVASWGAGRDNWPIVMAGMIILGSGGGLLNGETQKAIMASVPHERAGMASGISTTARFSGILLGFAVLSGILATLTKDLLSGFVCGDRVCGPNGYFSDAVVAGDLQLALAALPEAARPSAGAVAHLAYSNGFAAALATAAVVAGSGALAVWRLTRTGPKDLGD